jgi:hypothetical protein
MDNMGRKMENGFFHPGKCKVMSVTQNKSPVKFNYTLIGHPLESPEETKYLGLTMGKDLR